MTRTELTQSEPNYHHRNLNGKQVKQPKLQIYITKETYGKLSQKVATQLPKPNKILHRHIKKKKLLQIINCVRDYSIFTAGESCILLPSLPHKVQKIP